MEIYKVKMAVTTIGAIIWNDLPAELKYAETKHF